MRLLCFFAQLSSAAGTYCSCSYFLSRLCWAFSAITHDRHTHSSNLTQHFIYDLFFSGPNSFYRCHSVCLRQPSWFYRFVCGVLPPFFAFFHLDALVCVYPVLFCNFPSLHALRQRPSLLGSVVSGITLSVCLVLFHSLHVFKCFCVGGIVTHQSFTCHSHSPVQQNAIIT